MTNTQGIAVILVRMIILLQFRDLDCHFGRGRVSTLGGPAPFSPTDGGIRKAGVQGDGVGLGVAVGLGVSVGVEVAVPVVVAVGVGEEVAVLGGEPSLVIRGPIQTARS